MITKSNILGRRVLCLGLGLALVTLGGSLFASTATHLTPFELRCEFARDPIGVDVAQPRLSWKLDGNVRGDRQTAYQILVASSAEWLARDKGDLWNSGSVKSDVAIQIYYAGKPLTSSQAVFWKVRAWDSKRKVSDWSAPAKWTMGVLTDADWRGAKWIGETVTNAATTLLRREFTVKPGLRRAVAHVCGLGQYELTANGEKAGDDVLSPGWTTYTKTCLYDTRDITSLLRVGSNAVGIELANGMYSVPGGRYVKFKGSFGPRKAIALLRLEYADGSVENIVTDERWQRHSGPITFSCVYGGEDFDASLEPRGWDRAGFNPRDWAAVSLVTAPGGALRGLSCAAPPLRIFNWLRPQSWRRITNGVTVYDFGQNVPMMTRVLLRGSHGTVRLTPAELVKPDGTVERGSSGGRSAHWQYTMSGEGYGDLFYSKFFYHGARYLQVETIPAIVTEHRIKVTPTVAEVGAGIMHSSSEPVGEFACSNELFNRIHTLVRWAQRANMMSVLTDCPHRERLGWLEQNHLNGPSLRYEFDLAQLFTKGMNDMADAQLANGLVPNIAPEYVVFPSGVSWDPGGAFRDSPEWGSAFIIVPWQQYQFTGDADLLRRHYDAMKRYVAYLGSRATNHIVDHGLGDWYDLGPKPPGFTQLTPRALTATAFYQHDAWILSQAAKLLGKKADAKHFAKLAEEIRSAFNRKFFDETDRTYAAGSQCANAIPLVMNLCAPQNRTAVLSNLVADVKAKGITAGDVGFGYLLRALAEGGRHDVIFEMNNQSDRPGYGYQLKHGATSLTEAWDARRANSQNHFMLGQIMEWFYGDLAGIAPDPAAPGFKNVLIRPQPVGDVTWARASYDSVRGRIVSEWRLERNQLELTIQIPASTTATVKLPAAVKRLVSVNGQPPPPNPAVRMVSGQEQLAALQLPSGEYRIVADW